MLGPYFYNESIQRYTAVFGTLFNEIDYMRDGTLHRVPFRYVPVKRHLEKASYDNIDEKHRRRIVPAMTYKLTSMAYDPDRKLNKMNKMTGSRSGDSVKMQYQRVPYKFAYDLYITTKNLTDMLQIIEQILPHFDPTISVNIKDSEDLNIDSNIKITLVSNDLATVFEGSLEESDEIEVTLSFELDGYLYRSASQEAKVILSADVDFFLENNMDPDSLLSSIHEE